MGFFKTSANAYIDMQAADNYLQEQSESIRNVIKAFLRITMVVRIIASVPVIWVAYTDQLGLLSSCIFNQQNDGTVFFLTVDPLWTGFLLLLLFIPLIDVINNNLTMSFAGLYKNCIAEYFNILWRRDPKDEMKTGFSVKVFISAITLLIIMCVGNYTKITDEGMYFRRIWGGGEKYYNWAKIYKVDSSHEMVDNRYGPTEDYRFKAQITFLDGQVWTPDTVTGWQSEKVEDAVTFIKLHVKG